MRKASLAEAKAHLGELAVAGKQGGTKQAQGLSEGEIQALFDGLGAGSTELSAVEDLLSGRR